MSRLFSVTPPLGSADSSIGAIGAPSPSAAADPGRPAAATPPPVVDHQASLHLTVHPPTPHADADADRTPMPSSRFGTADTSASFPRGSAMGGGAAAASPFPQLRRSPSAGGGLSHETLLLQAQAQIRELLPYKERAMQLQSDVRLANDRAQQHEAQIHSLEALVRREHARADARSTEASAELAGKLQESNDQLLLERRRGEAWRDERDRLHGDLEQLRRDAESDAHAHNERAARLQRTIDELENTIERGRSRETRSDALRDDLATAERRLFESVEDAEKLRRRVADVERDLAASITAKAAALDRLHDAELENRALPGLRLSAGEGQAAQSEVRRLSEALEKAETELRRARTGETELKDAVERLKKRAGSLEEDLHVAVTERASYKAQAEELSATRRECSEAVRSLTSEREMTTELRSLLATAENEMHNAARESQRMLREMADEAESLVSTAKLAAESATIDNASPIRGHPGGDRHSVFVSNANADGHTTTNTTATNAAAADISAGARILHSRAHQHEAAMASSSNNAGARLSPTRPPRSRGNSPTAQPTDQSAASVHASMQTLKNAVERLTTALRHQRAANIELLRVEGDCRSTVSDLEARLREATREAADQRVQATRANQAASQARHDAEDFETDCRRARRQAADLAIRVQNACTEISRLRLRIDGELSPAKIASPPPPSSSTKSEPDTGETTSEDLAGVISAGERALSRLVEFTKAIVDDNGRIADKMAEQAREFGTERQVTIAHTQRDVANMREQLNASERAQASLKESLSRAVVRHDEAVAERAGVQHDHDRLTVRFDELEHEARTLRTEKDSLREQAADVESQLDRERARTDAEKRNALEAQQRCDRAETDARRFEAQRDNVRVMLGCSVAAVSRLRCDLRELLLQRRLIDSWTRELEGALVAIRSTCVDDPAKHHDHGNGNESQHYRVARFTGTPIRGVARFRIAAIAVLVAVRLKASVAPHEVYAGSAALESAGLGVQRRPRFRSSRTTAGDATHGRPASWQSNVSILARAVPVPSVDDLMACVAVDGGSLADAVVEGLLTCFAAPARLTMPPPNMHNSYLPQAHDLTEELASPERRRPDPRLLLQLRGTELDLTQLRRLNAGQCAVPAARSVGTPIAASRDVCAAVRDSLRKTGQALNDAKQRTHKLQQQLSRALAEGEEAERRAAEYARRLSEAAIGFKADKRQQMIDDSARRHHETMAKGEAAAERRRADEAIAELARREATIRDERMRLETERKAAAAAAASFEAMNSRRRQQNNAAASGSGAATPTPSILGGPLSVASTATGGARAEVAGAGGASQRPGRSTTAATSTGRPRRGSDASMGSVEEIRPAPSARGDRSTSARGGGGPREAVGGPREAVGGRQGTFADPTVSSVAKKAAVAGFGSQTPAAQTVGGAAGINRSHRHHHHREHRHHDQDDDDAGPPNVTPMTHHRGGGGGGDTTTGFDVDVLGLLDSIDARLSSALHGHEGCSPAKDGDDDARLQRRLERKAQRRRDREEQQRV